MVIVLDLVINNEDLFINKERGGVHGAMARMLRLRVVVSILRPPSALCNQNTVT